MRIDDWHVHSQREKLNVRPIADFYVHKFDLLI